MRCSLSMGRPDRVMVSTDRKQFPFGKGIVWGPVFFILYLFGLHAPS